MRSYHYLLCAFALSFFADSSIALRHPLRVRQDNSPTAVATGSPAPTNTDAGPASSTAAASSNPLATVSSIAQSSQSASSKPVSTDISSTAAASTIIQAPSTFVSIIPTASATALPDGLPIQPKLTPAMGITGVILLVSGVVYTVIGIKNKWLYVFFSACYLTSLAVTVLIVYLMSPPVSDAVQGAFFVAAFLSGLIFGALSLIFADITDGLGCLLGGFCLSMWFLTLKAGGLITSTAGRAIFIGCMSFAAFSLSFSHYTRTYGLIVATSFAGATATILGIDCLSRAGLKEFWLYIWALNDDEFPLNTNTYPITRAIRVEIAGTVLLCLLGLVSQFRLWKVVKERREKHAAIRLEQEQNQQREEEALGRRNQDRFDRERAQWEAAYGDKMDKSYEPDSGIGSSSDSIPKTSVSVREPRKSAVESVEMVDMSPSQEASEKGFISRPSSKRVSAPTVTVRVLQDDEIQPIDADGNPFDSRGTSGRRSGTPSAAIGSARTSLDRKPSDSGYGTHAVSSRSSLRSSVPPPPAVVPLPFTIPTEESDREDNASLSTVPETHYKKRSLSQRFSDSAMNRLSMTRASFDNSELRQSLIIPHIEEDRASSLAATLDEVDEDKISLPALSRQPSQLTLSFEEEISNRLSQYESDGKKETTNIIDKEASTPLGPSAVQETNRNVIDSNGSNNHHGIETATKAGERQSLTASTDPKPGDIQPRRTSNSQRRRSDTAHSDEQTDGQGRRKSKSIRSVAASEASGAGSHVGSLKEVLPEGLSKIALSYRTNEWAKHLELAEKPELDAIEEPASPGVQVEHGFQETAKPVDVDIIQPNRRTSTKPTRDASQTSQTNAYRHSHGFRPPIHVPKRASVEDPSGTLSRAASSSTLGGVVSPAPMSRSSSAARTKGLRSSSTPFPGQPMMESPIDEESATTRFTPSPNPEKTLMGMRESFVRNKASTQSFSRNSSLPNVATLAAIGDGDDIPLNERKKLIDQDNMTLAQRKHLIQSQQAQPSGEGRQPMRDSVQGFNSHQPKRASTMDHGKREVLMANWRESIRQDQDKNMTPFQVAPAEKGRRQAMINERRQKEMEKQQQAAAATQRESTFDDMMRRGDMLDAHREAMRRMQAAANKKA